MTDVYLADIGDYAYGYCNTDLPPGEYVEGNAVYTFCVLDNDYSFDEFGDANTPAWSFMQVTAAHEYFHAVQAAYDWEEDFWLLEATATWVEDEVYDDINDNVGYLPYGQLGGAEAAGGYPVSRPRHLARPDGLQRLRQLDLVPLPDREVHRRGGRAAHPGPRHLGAADSTNGAADDQYSLQAIDSRPGTSAAPPSSSSTPLRRREQHPGDDVRRGRRARLPDPGLAFPTVDLTPQKPTHHRGREARPHDQRHRRVHARPATWARAGSSRSGSTWHDVDRGSQAAVDRLRHRRRGRSASYVELNAQGDGSRVSVLARPTSRGRGHADQRQRPDAECDTARRTPVAESASTTRAQQIKVLLPVIHGPATTT